MRIIEHFTIFFASLTVTRAFASTALPFIKGFKGGLLRKQKTVTAASTLDEIVDLNKGGDEYERLIAEEFKFCIIEIIDTHLHSAN
jgi:hypothetical protein